MKKKLLSVLLCAAMVGSLAAGCGSKNDKKDASDGDGKTVLTSVSYTHLTLPTT